jgi:hypothetical protein
MLYTVYTSFVKIRRAVIFYYCTDLTNVILFTALVLSQMEREVRGPKGGGNGVNFSSRICSHTDSVNP